MPLSALPEHLQDVENNFPDDKQFGDKKWWARLYTRYNKFTKTWFAFSWRCDEWWARTTTYPRVLIAFAGDGFWRFESADGQCVPSTDEKWYILNEDFGEEYLSRIQYYTRWHFAIQLAIWHRIPFAFPMISFHWYSKASDVPVPGEPRPDLDGKLWFVYWGHFDADCVHWLVTSGYIGRNWK